MEKKNEFNAPVGSQIDIDTTIGKLSYTLFLQEEEMIKREREIELLKRQIQDQRAAISFALQLRNGAQPNEAPAPMPVPETGEQD